MLFLRKVWSTCRDLECCRVICVKYVSICVKSSTRFFELRCPTASFREKPPVYTRMSLAKRTLYCAKGIFLRRDYTSGTKLAETKEKCSALHVWRIPAYITKLTEKHSSPRRRSPAKKSETALKQLEPAHPRETDVIATGMFFYLFIYNFIRGLILGMTWHVENRTVTWSCLTWYHLTLYHLLYDTANAPRIKYRIL